MMMTMVIIGRIAFTMIWMHLPISTVKSGLPMIIQVSGFRWKLHFPFSTMRT